VKMRRTRSKYLELVHQLRKLKCVAVFYLKKVNGI
jgi:hypothetical protein